MRRMCVINMSPSSADNDIRLRNMIYNCAPVKLKAFRLWSGGPPIREFQAAVVATAPKIKMQ